MYSSETVLVSRRCTVTIHQTNMYEYIQKKVAGETLLASGLSLYPLSQNIIYWQARSFFFFFFSLLKIHVGQSWGIEKFEVVTEWRAPACIWVRHLGREKNRGFGATLVNVTFCRPLKQCTVYSYVLVHQVL